MSDHNSNNMNLTLHVWRQKGPNAPGKLETYDAKHISPDMSFLEMLPGSVVLGPMAKGCNLPYRRLCVELGARVTCSEMALARRLKQIMRLLADAGRTKEGFGRK